MHTILLPLERGRPVPADRFAGGQSGDFVAALHSASSGGVKRGIAGAALARRAAAEGGAVAACSHRYDTYGYLKGLRQARLTVCITTEGGRK